MLRGPLADASRGSSLGMGPVAALQSRAVLLSDCPPATCPLFMPSGEFPLRCVPSLFPVLRPDDAMSL